MNATDLPVVRQIVRTGASDRVYDACMILGPLLVVAVVLLGRRWYVEAAVATYLVAFAGYVLYKGVLRAADDEATASAPSR